MLFIWSSIGAASAPDYEIFAYARNHDLIVFTHDLDFGTLLAATQARSPSVVQIRSQDILPSHLADRLVAVLAQYREQLMAGAILVIDESRERVRMLPLGGKKE